jgi:tetratricopeptide (TPR) repeat protein/DNA-binding XRE family transcriptional regulator
MAQPKRRSGGPAASGDWLPAFGGRLRMARGRAGLTQALLGSPDLSKSFISLLESGRSWPSVGTVVALAHRLDTSVASLLFGAPELRRDTALSLLHVAGELDLVSHAREASVLVDTAGVLFPDMTVEHRIKGLLVRAHAAIHLPDLDQADRYAREACVLATERALPAAIGRANAVLGEVAFLRRSFASARTHLRQAVSSLKLAKATKTTEYVRAMLSLGATSFYRDELDQAMRAYRRASETAAKLNLTALRGRGVMGLGFVTWRRKQFAATVRHFTQAKDLFTRVEDRLETSRALNNLGLVYRDQGRFAESLKALQRALRIKEQLNLPRDRSSTLDEIALTSMALGRLPDAENAARRAIADAQLAGDRVLEADAHVTLARVLQADARAQEAAEMLRRAVGAFMKLGMRRKASSAAATLAKLLRENGERAEAARYVAIAIRNPRIAPRRGIASRPLPIAGKIEPPPRS